MPARPVLLDRFGLLLLVVLATIVAQSLVDVTGSPLGALVTHAASGLALVVAVRAGGVGRRLRRGADALVVVTLLANLTLVLVPEAVGDRDAPPGEVLWVLAAVLVPVAVARRVAFHREVTLQTVMGSVAAYLQVAVAYSTIFQVLDTNRSLFGDAVPTTRYTYLSLQSISTLGFGDAVPVTDLGRLVAVSEAVVGQVFLVTFVALIVARFATASPTGPGGRDEP